MIHELRDELRLDQCGLTNISSKLITHLVHLQFDYAALFKQLNYAQLITVLISIVHSYHS